MRVVTQPTAGFDALRTQLLDGLTAYAQGIADSVLAEWNQAVRAVPQLGRAASEELVALLALEAPQREAALRARWRRERDGDDVFVRGVSADHRRDWEASVAADAVRAEELAVQRARIAAEAVAVAREQARAARMARFARDVARADEIAGRAGRIMEVSRRADEQAARSAERAARAARIAEDAVRADELAAAQAAEEARLEEQVARSGGAAA